MKVTMLTDSINIHLSRGGAGGKKTLSAQSAIPFRAETVNF